MNPVRNQQNFNRGYKTIMKSNSQISNGMNEEKKVLLIIDDEEDIRMELNDILKNKYHVVCAKDGEDARRMLVRKGADIVLLDLKLPDINGVELIKDIKAAKEDACIVIITAYGSLDTAVKAIKENVYDYVAKPFSLANLMSIIDKAVSEQAVKREALRHAEKLEKFQEMTTGRELKMIE